MGVSVHIRGRLAPTRRPVPLPMNPFSLPETTLQMFTELGAMHKQLLELIATLEQKHAAFDEIKQGPAGIGVPGRDADHAAIVHDVVKQIRQPADGKSPGVEALAAALFPLVLAHVTKNLPKTPKIAPVKASEPVDHAKVMDAIFAELEKGSRKIKMGHIDGLDNKIAEIRNAAAMGNTPEIYGKTTWARGGGDTVVAGPGVTIVETPDGTKKISAAGGGTFVINEVVNGSGTAWTLANTPITNTLMLYAEGQRLIPGVDYTIVGAAITTTLSWAGGTLLADYQK